MAARGHEVRVLGSAATRPAAERAGCRAEAYRRAPEPDTRIPFERQAAAMMATAAGLELASDVQDTLAGDRPALAIVDCMLPAGLAAARATGTPAASLAHFLYGVARRHMAARGGSWTTDLHTLRATCGAIGLEPPASGLDAWEDCDLVLVSAPRWLDAEIDYPARVTHAGPLGIERAAEASDSGPPEGPPTVLLSFSTSAMDGQAALAQRVCDAVGETGVRALLTLGPAIDGRELRVPAGVAVSAWGDHDSLLPSCAAVIGHAGLGTTLRSLAHGVPLVLLPLGRDQALNAARVEELGAGTALAPDAAPASIRSALGRVLEEPGFAAAARAAAARIAADEPDRRAGEALEACFR